jgi:hypothetical protein
MEKFWNLLIAVRRTDLYVSGRREVKTEEF